MPGASGSLVTGRPRAGTSDPHARPQADSLPPELSAQMTSITTKLARDDRTEKLVESIASLDRDDQRLVLYRGLEGLTAKEAAPLLGLSAEVIKKRWQRLRAQLETVPTWKELLDAS